MNKSFRVDVVANGFMVQSFYNNDNLSTWYVFNNVADLAKYLSILVKELNNETKTNTY